MVKKFPMLGTRLLSIQPRPLRGSYTLKFRFNIISPNHWKQNSSFENFVLCIISTLVASVRWTCKTTVSDSSHHFFFVACDTVHSVVLLAAPVLSLRHFALISWGCWSGVGGTKLHFKGSNYIVATSGVCTCKRLGENGFVVSKMGPHSARRRHTVCWYHDMNIWACNMCLLSLCHTDYACGIHWGGKKRQDSIFVLENR